MTSIIQTIQKRSFFPTNQDLPLSQTSSKEEQSLRRRLSSSLSLNLQPISSSPASSWAFRRSKSVSSMGEYAGTSIRKWWDWGWSWVLSRKPIFAKDLELNEEESAVLGCNSKGSWRHVLYKVRCEVRKLVKGRSDRVGLPQTYRYDSYNYSKNFDGGIGNRAHQG